jgi:soluble lytic murein transglycosylase-like protein
MGLLQALVAVAGLVLVVAGALAVRPQTGPVRAVAQPAPQLRPFRPAEPVVRAPAGLSTALDADAARGFDRSLFTASPGGLQATAARVAGWRPLVRRAGRASAIGPNLLEAIVLVESSGEAGAISPSGAAGLTQLSPGTARRLRLRVNLGRSRALTGRIERAGARGAARTARQLVRWRARYDQRFSPALSLRATASFLARAQRIFGRDDLAVAAYHLGIPTVRAAVAAYGGEAPSYAELYFGSGPDLHARTWRLLRAGGDYYWKVLAAKRVMTLSRRDPAGLRFEGEQQAKKNSAEEVLHPRYRTARFTSPRAIASAWRHHVLRAIPADARRTHVAIAGSFGAEAYKLGRSRRLYRGLRPATLDVLLYIGRQVHELSGARRPLIVTSALRDLRYQRVLMRVNANAARSYSIHTTGYAFDVARAYASPAQAAAFEFVLDRLVAVNAIAYIRESGAIHVAVASDAAAKLALLARL